MIIAQFKSARANPFFLTVFSTTTEDGGARRIRQEEGRTKPRGGESQARWQTIHDGTYENP